MSEQARLNVHVRENVGRKSARELRKQGLIPGELYGHGQKNMHVAINLLEFKRLYANVGESALFDVVIEGRDEAQKVLVQDVQRNSKNLEPTHIDFYMVRMDEKLRTFVPVVFEGVSPAVKNLGGTLVTVKDELEVQCLPKDLPANIVVDLSTLSALDSRIRVFDLNIGEGVTILEDANTSVVMVEAPRSEEEMAELDKAVDLNVEAVEKIKKPEKEGDEATATEAASADTAKAKAKTT